MKSMSLGFVHLGTTVGLFIQRTPRSLDLQKCWPNMSLVSQKKTTSQYTAWNFLFFRTPNDVSLVWSKSLTLHVQWLPQSSGHIWKKKHVLATSPSFGSPSFGYPLLYIWPLGHSCPDQIPLSTLKNGHRSFGLNWIFAAQSLPSVKNPNFWLMFIVIPTYSKLTCLAWFCLKINYLHFSRQKINDLSEITIMLRGVPINMVIKFPKLPTFPSQTAKNYHLFPITAAPHAASWAAWRIVSWPRSSVPPGKVV